jgi:NADPH:quinone reductase-like Zn-dependent oxidoreductase
MLAHELAHASETVLGVLDTVAGKSFGTYVTALRPAGVLSLVGAVGGSDVSFDAYQLLQVKGVVGKSISANSRVRATRPSAIGIFSEIFAPGLGTKCRFSLGHGRLLSVCGIDGIGAR